MKKRRFRFGIVLLMCLQLLAMRATFAQDAPTAPVSDNYFSLLQTVTLADGDPAGLVFNLSGQVVDSAGTPVPDAVVVLRESSTQRISADNTLVTIESRNDHIVKDVFARTRTDQEGRYEFRQAAAPMMTKQHQTRWQRWNWWVAAASSDGDFGWKHIKKAYNGHEEITKQIDVELRRSVPIEGTLLSTDGQPVADALVRLGTLDQLNPVQNLLPSDDYFDANASSLQLSQRTDANGKFRFPSTPDQLAFNVSVSHPVHTFGYYRLTNNPQISPVLSDDSASVQPSTAPLVRSPCTLSALEQIIVRGRVVDESGQPIAGAHVQKQSTVMTAKTDSDGQFQWPIAKLSMSKYSRSASHADAEVSFLASVPSEPYIHQASYFSTSDLLAGRPQTIVLKRGCELTGKVICKQTGQGVPGIRVAAALTGLGYTPPMAMTRTNSKGVYRIVSPIGRLRIGVGGPIAGYAVPPFDWSKLQSANDPLNASPLVRDIDVTGKTQFDLADFSVNALPSIQVLVLDPDEKPVANAIVHAYYQRQYENHQFGGERSLAPIETTGKDGTCRMLPNRDDWKLGVIRVQAKIEGASFHGHSTMSRDDRERIPVKMKQGWLLTGRVLKDGKPAHNVNVRLRRHNNKGAATFRGMTQYQEMGITTTDRDGNYQFEVAPDERYSISTDDPGSWRRKLAYRSTPLDEHHYHFNDIEFISPDQARPANGTIQGTVVDFSGAPLSGARVHSVPTRLQTGVNARTDVQGRFVLTGLRDGEAQLIVQVEPKNPQSPRWAASIEATVGDDDVQIAMDRRILHPVPELKPVQVITMQHERIVDDNEQSELTGRVLDEEDRPVAGAVVRVHAAISRAALGKNGIFSLSDLAFPGKGKQALTDAQGHFRIKNVRSECMFDVAIGASGHQGHLFRDVDPRDDNLGFNLSATPDLDPKTSFSARVVDVDGKPIAGATAKAKAPLVTLMNIPIQQRVAQNTSATVTDKDGHFSLQFRMPVRSTQLLVQCPGYASTVANCLLSSAPKQAIVLTAGSSIGGRLMHDGRPVEGVPVQLTPLDHSLRNVRQALTSTTDQQGFFGWDHLTPETEFTVWTAAGKSPLAALPKTIVRTSQAGELADYGDVQTEAGHKLALRFITEDRRPIPAKSYCTLTRPSLPTQGSVLIPERFASTVRFNGVPTEVVSILLSVPTYKVVNVEPNCHRDGNGRYTLFCDDDKSFTFTLQRHFKD
ncbi:carboxypeptidase regulatory-like domain-containing protein [Planctomycetes bacterium K23_9]|uniref:Nickel uptake substrate-specific transmembrane region n=1 Tax=Stieleria marina TaxID=1930275 RepID=A0A517NW52_9BACT|nr:Nickel uptake substrate-specific transmembrane region [Planctomycetes bacterium K23_9]